MFEIEDLPSSMPGTAVKYMRPTNARALSVATLKLRWLVEQHVKRMMHVWNGEPWEQEPEMPTITMTIGAFRADVSVMKIDSVGGLCLTVIDSAARAMTRELFPDIDERYGDYYISIPSPATYLPAPSGVLVHLFTEVPQRPMWQEECYANALTALRHVKRL